MAGAVARITQALTVRRVRIVFWCYAALVFTLTHWPALQVPNPVRRTDIIAHLVVFGGWTYIACACGWFGARWSWRNIRSTAMVSLAYAAFDEGTQAIPWIRRHAGWDDFLANVLGVAAGCLAAWLTGVLLARWSPDLNRPER
ncbi:MAG: VanZ family protein [Phycisphaeraceae bacterium]|nr:VanZ family protein [Phycisphaeraceae bacterium]